MKITALLMACLLIFCLTGCEKKETAQFDIRSIADLSETMMEEHLLGTSRETIIQAWGEPDESSQDAGADRYCIPETDKQLILYYDADGILKDIKVLNSVMEK